MPSYPTSAQLSATLIHLHYDNILFIYVNHSRRCSCWKQYFTTFLSKLKCNLPFEVKMPCSESDRFCFVPLLRVPCLIFKDLHWPLSKGLKTFLKVSESPFQVTNALFLSISTTCVLCHLWNTTPNASITLRYTLLEHQRKPTSFSGCNPASLKAGRISLRIFGGYPSDSVVG